MQACICYGSCVETRGHLSWVSSMGHTWVIKLVWQVFLPSEPSPWLRMTLNILTFLPPPPQCWGCSHSTGFMGCKRLNPEILHAKPALYQLSNIPGPAWLLTRKEWVYGHCFYNPVRKVSHSRLWALLMPINTICLGRGHQAWLCGFCWLFPPSWGKYLQSQECS